MADYRILAVEWLESRRLLAADVLISEFAASNTTTILDEDGDSSDWIEVFNAGPDDTNLANWHLTDNVDRPKKWSFPAVDLAAGSSLIIFASNKDRAAPDSPLHTNFKLDADGEYLALTRNGASVEAIDIVSEFAPTYPPQFEDISYGITQNDEGNDDAGGLLRFFETPTPGSLNPPSGKEAIRADVTFSHPHGFYDQAIPLSIVTEVGTSVRYTLDGTEPTQQNGQTYRSPINIRSSTTVRARAYHFQLEPSPIVTATYLYLEDIVEQSRTGRAPSGFPSSRSINGQTLDYGMDPEIVDSATWGPQLADALTQVPSMSLVMDIDALLDSRDGIYTHAREHGREWERAASLELIHPDGSDGFQVDAGVRIRGGFSRSSSNPKHAFRFFFRDEWGAAKLEYPLFGDEGVEEFDKFDLRTAQNYSWSFRGDNRNTFVRDVFSRDLQRELGHPYTRSRYYHLYINGQYWGLFQSQERAEARFAASYFGGDSDDYDVVKSAGSSGDYENEATDGTLDAYQRLAALFYQRGGLSNDSVYFRAQGMNLDGTSNPNYERLLDVDNLIDFAITTYFAGDRDGPVSRFVNGVNNYFAIYNREAPDGFKFFEHDSEHTLDVGFSDLAEQATSNGSQFRYFNPLWMHEQLVESNSEYQLRFADRILELTRNDGVLSDTKTLELLDQRIGEIDQAVIAESARWGDAKQDDPFTKDDWLQAVDDTRNFLVDRGAVLVEQFRNLGWFPSVERPMVQVETEPRDGGPISMAHDISLLAADAVNFNQSLIAARSTWKYLDDGSDQGTAWQETDFNDTSWRSGRGQLGYGDGDESTRIRFGSTNDKHITTYFRKSFEVSSPESLDRLRLRLLRDDGAVVYLNGEEVARSNMGPGEITSVTPASGSATGATESVYFQFNLKPDLLRNGTNVLAVELHQVNPTTSDASFDAELLGGQISGSRQTIHYTLDGQDPRLPGGNVHPNAIRHSRDFSIPKSATLLARSRLGNIWSPLLTADFEVIDPRLEAIDDLIIVNESQNAISLSDGSTSILSNDIGLQAKPVRVTRVSGPAHSNSFKLNADGTFEYQHNGAEKFTDAFTYRVTDANGKSDIGEVRIEINRISDTTPVANNDAMTVSEGLSTSVLVGRRSSVLDNDEGLADTPVLVELHRPPIHAEQFTFEDDGTFFYRHNGSETRFDSFAYRIQDNDGQIGIAEVAITVNPRNDSIPSPRPDEIRLNEGGTSAVLVSGEPSVLANDLGIIDSPFVVSIRKSPQYASEFVLLNDGTFSYTHDGGNSREDTFTYDVRDFEGEVGTGVVHIQIDPVDSGAPLAVDDVITVNEAGFASRLSTGEASVLANDQNLFDAPYEVFLDRPPTTARQFSLKPDGTFTYRHDNSEVHSDSFTYRIEDFDGDVAIGQVFIEVIPISDARPVARDDKIEVVRNGTTTELINGAQSVLDNDIQLDDGPILISLVTPPQHSSSFAFFADGSFAYTHDGSSKKSDSFVYRIEDNDGQSSLADVDIAILALEADFDANGVVDQLDIDLLVQGIQSGSGEDFDLNQDLSVDDADIDYMIMVVLKTRPGDTDLDGDVDFADFLQFSSVFGASDAKWEDGNFDLDSTVGFADFLALSQHFGFESDAQ